MKKFLGMESVSTLEDVCKIVLLSPMWVSVGLKAEIDNGKCYLSVTNCIPQEARTKRGLTELPCKSMGQPILKDLHLHSIPSLNLSVSAVPLMSTQKMSGASGKLTGFKTKHSLRDFNLIIKPERTSPLNSPPPIPNINPQIHNHEYYTLLYIN